jgi:uncharacterized protein (TIGR03118 family)
VRRLVASIAVLAVLVGSAAAAAAPSDRFAVRNILASSPLIPADRYDPNLVNPWGLVSSPTSPWWPANNGTDTSTIVPATGAVNNTVVTVPGGPTGIVWNGTAGAFPIPGGPSTFVFNTELGEIYGWRAGNNTAQLGISRTSAGAVYLGMTLAITTSGPRLYSTDFHNARIDVVDAQWQLVSLPPGAFVDPDMPADYAPYGIQTVGDRIFVTYARQDAAKLRELPGPGVGAVSVFDFDGTFLGRVATGGPLNAPWGIALADPNFGAFGGQLLIGNFGDGKLHGYRENADGTWTHTGALKNLDGSDLAIGGLWAIQFGSGAPNNGARNHLYFVAGPFGETQGVMGRIMPNPSEAGGLVPATLALALGAAPSFGAFIPGVANDYSASLSATITHTAADALLTVSDPSPTATGHLVNGAFALEQPLRASATSPGATGGALAPVGGPANPTTLLTYTGPIGNDPATIDFSQPIGPV